jgi:hypothetical protein
MNELVGDQSASISRWLMWPVLYLTDITADPKHWRGRLAGGRLAHRPERRVRGWKAAVRTVDKTMTPARPITPDKDPARTTNLAGGDLPAGLTTRATAPRRAGASR